MQQRLLLRAAQPALDVVAPRAPFDGGVDRDDRVEVGRLQGTDLDGGGSDGRRGHGGRLRWLEGWAGQGGRRSGVDRVGEGELAIGLVVEQIVEHGQQRHRLLLDVRHLALHQLGGHRCSVLRCSGGSVPAASCAASGCSSAATARSVSCSLGEQGGEVAVAGLGHAREQLALLEAEVMADLVFELALRGAASDCSVAASPLASAWPTRSSSAMLLRCSSSSIRDTGA